MKNKLILTSLALALPVFAGTPAQVAPPPAQPSLWSWFAGGSVGYLSDAQEAMYNVHIGVDTPWNLGGWNVAIFGEVGYTDIDDSNAVLVRSYQTSIAAVSLPVWAPVDVETEIIPVTLNVKFERPLMDKLNVYMGGGLGVAFIDVSSNSPYAPYNFSRNDQVFTAQVFAGLNYNFSPAFEVYGGARWIYFDNFKTGDFTSDSNDDWLFELGARFNF